MRVLYYASSSSSPSCICFWKFGWFVLIVGISLIHRPFVANAQAPPNDLCINAQPVDIGSSPISNRINTTNATIDSDVADDCISGKPPSTKGIWFNFTGTGKRMVARACFDDALFSSFSTGTSISVFTGGCSISTRQCVAATNSGCGEERFFFDTTMGTTYHVLVQNTQAFRSEIVDVSIFEAPPRGNDLCVDAQPVVLGFPIFLRFNTTYATADVGCSGNSTQIGISFKGIWFNFTGTGRRIVASARLVPPPNFNDVFPGIAVFIGGCEPSTRQCVAATDSSNFGDRFIFQTTLGTSYYVLVTNPSSAVDVAFSEAPPVSNDDCVNALPVVIGSSNVSMTFDTTYASTDLDVADNCLDSNPPNKKGIWFMFTGTGGRVIARAGTSFSGTSCECSFVPALFGSTGTSISVFTGGCEPSTRQCVAATNDGCEQFIVNTTVGTTYHVLVRNCYSTFTSSVDVSIFQAPPIPTTPTLTPTIAPKKLERPTLTPTVAPTKLERPPCGLFGLNFFCPRPGKCGFFRRFFGINGCSSS